MVQHGKIQAVAFIFFILMSPSTGAVASMSSTDCTNVTTLIHQQFTRYYLLQRRGCPENFVMSFYKQYVRTLTGFVRTTYPKSKTLGSTCLLSSDIVGFNSTYDYSAVDQAIDDMKYFNRSIFFLPPDIIKDLTLLEMNDDQQKLVDAAWHETEGLLGTTPTFDLTDRVAILPRTLPLFFDPLKLEVKYGYEYLLNADGVSNVYWSAKSMIAKTIGMVIRMELLGVPRESSVHILEHCVGHVFNAIRHFRMEGEEAQVTNVYFPWYKSALKMLTKDPHNPDRDIDSEVPEVPEALVEYLLGSEVELLSSFNSWGGLSHFNLDLRVVSLVDIQTHIFNPQVLQTFEKELNVTKPTPTTRIGVTTARTVATCDPDVYYYFSAYSSPPSPDAHCCALICKNLNLLTYSSGVSELTCCQNCNEYECFPSTSNAIYPLSIVMFVPFGWYGFGFITVMI